MNWKDVIYESEEALTCQVLGLRGSSSQGETEGENKNNALVERTRGQDDCVAPFWRSRRFQHRWTGSVTGSFREPQIQCAPIGHDGSVYLRNVYSRECRFCIVLISQAYDQRDWTNLEREAVQARELRGERGILIPVSIEDYQPTWLPETRIRFDLWKRTVPELVELLTKRCRST